MIRCVFFLLLLYVPICPAQPVGSLTTDHGVVSYTIDGTFAVTEGDIILGTVADVERLREAQEQEARGLQPRSLAIIPGIGGQLWPDATLYYSIDADVPNQQSILDGIAYWNTHTAIRILPRTAEVNYVRFQRVNVDAACNSFIGQIGGAQTLGITNNCPTGSVIHELGHALGLWHEQQRADRAGHLTVLYENIDKRFLSNFPQATSAADTSYYDFDSIMHYGANGFSRNYQDALETVPPGIPLGQRLGQSTGDIEGVSRLYKIPITATTVTTAPVGLPITVDGVAGVSPQSFNWGAGTQHTVSVVAAQGTEPRYIFTGWSDSGALSHTLTASAALTALSANFVRQHTFETGATPAQGSVAAYPRPDSGYLPERAQVRITASAAPGYQFVRWTGSTALSGSGQSVSANPAYIEIQNSPANYQATFTNGPVTTVDSKPAGATVSVDGLSYLTPVRFAWTPGSTHTLNYATPQLYGNNTRRWQFAAWEDGSTGSRPVTAAATSTLYAASFTAQYLLTFSQSGSGTVVASPSSADGFYDAGTPVQLTAVPSGSQTFRYWLGDIAGGAASGTVKMDQDRLANAYFGSALSFRVLSSASLLSSTNVGSSATTIAPGQILAIFGSSLGPVNGVLAAIGADGKLPFSLSGTKVEFDGVAAPLLYVSDKQVNVVAPFALTGKSSSTVRVTAGTTVQAVSVGVAATAPALFTADGSGRGQLAAFNENGTVNSATNPAAPGSIVVLFATGGGIFEKTFPDGLILGTDLAKPTAPLWVRFGKLPGEVLYAGTAPFLVNGALQVNVRLPGELIGGGAVPVQLLVGTAGSQTGASISVAAAP